MTVAELKQSLVGVPDDAEVVFQGNENNGDEDPEDATYTSVMGTVFEAFERGKCIGSSPREFVIDGFITEREN